MKIGNRIIKHKLNRSGANPVKKRRQPLIGELSARHGKVRMHRTGTSFNGKGPKRSSNVKLPNKSNVRKSANALVNKNKISKATHRGISKSTGLYSGKINRGYRRSSHRTRGRR